jgi:hypothetical protein
LSQRNKSTIAARFGGEALHIRDIQFYDPQIGITGSAPLEPCSHDLLVCFGFRSNDGPFIPLPTAE